MMSVDRRTIRVAFSAHRLFHGLVLTGLLSVAGCSMPTRLWKSEARPSAPAPVYTETRSSSPRTVAPAPASELTAVTTGAAPGEVQAVPAVNVFGEIGSDVVNVPSQLGGQAGFQQQTFLDEGHDAAVSVCPAGEWMVFASTRHSEKPDLYLQRTGGLSVIQLTADAAEDAYPSFSPDGKQIAFCSARAGNWDIYLTDVDGKNVVQVTSGPMQDIHPSFSPDGTKLVYCSMGGKSGQWEIWTVDLASNAKQMIGFGLFPVWSPERGVDRVTFQRARQRGSRWFSVWTLEIADGEARRLTEVAVSANAALVSPSWSPDGKKLTFASIVEPASPGDASGKPGRQQDIWVVNVDGSGRHRITDGKGTNVEPFWATNDRIFFISDRGGVEAVWSASIDAIATTTARTGTPSPVKETIGSTDAGAIGR